MNFIALLIMADKLNHQLVKSHPTFLRQINILHIYKIYKVYFPNIFALSLPIFSALNYVESAMYNIKRQDYIRDLIQDLLGILNCLFLMMR